MCVCFFKYSKIFKSNFQYSAWNWNIIVSQRFVYNLFLPVFVINHIDFRYLLCNFSRSIFGTTVTIHISNMMNCLCVWPVIDEVVHFFLACMRARFLMYTHAHLEYLFLDWSILSTNHFWIYLFYFQKMTKLWNLFKFYDQYV